MSYDPTQVTPMSKDLLRLSLDPTGPEIIAVCGGIGSGKSVALAQLIFATAMTRPGSSILATAGSANLLMSVLHPDCAEVFDGAAVWNGGITYPHWLFANGSTVDFRAYQLPATRDEASNPLEGRSYSLLIGDEVGQLPVTFLEHSLQRTRESSKDLEGRTHRPKVIWCGRPGAIDHWVKEAEELAKAGIQTTILRPRTQDNPFIWMIDDETGERISPYIERMKANLTEEVFDCLTQRIPGATMPVEKAILSNFQATMLPDGNLIEWTYDPYMTTRAAIDFGVNTTAVLWIQEAIVNARPAHIIFDEWCPDDATSTQDIVREILSRPYTLHEAVVDPAGKQRQRAAGLTSEVDILRRDVDYDPDGLGGGLGIPLDAVSLDGEKVRIEAGIIRMQARFAAADGTRALYVATDLWNSPQYSRGIRHTIQQYQRGNDGVPLKGRKGRHADHVADALRQYVVRLLWDGATVVDVGPMPSALTQAQRMIAAAKGGNESVTSAVPRARPQAWGQGRGHLGGM